MHASPAPALTIWCNAKFSDADTERLVAGTRGHRLVFSKNASTSVLAAGRADPALEAADVAFGQPDAVQCLATSRLRWVALTTAGYTRYDAAEFREKFGGRGAVLTSVSQVFADSCAQHVLAMMLTLGRQLLHPTRCS